MTEAEGRALTVVCAPGQIYVAQTVAANQAMQSYGSQHNQTKDGMDINTLRTESFKLFKRPFPGFFLTILTL